MVSHYAIQKCGLNLLTNANSTAFAFNIHRIHSKQHFVASIRKIFKTIMNVKA